MQLEGYWPIEERVPGSICSTHILYLENLPIYYYSGLTSIWQHAIIWLFDYLSIPSHGKISSLERESYYVNAGLDYSALASILNEMKNCIAASSR